MNTQNGNKQIDDIEEKKLQLTKKFNTEIYNINEGIQLLALDEIPDAVRKSILDEIEYGFNEKWKYYKTAIQKLDDEISDLKRYY